MNIKKRLHIIKNAPAKMCYGLLGCLATGVVFATQTTDPYGTTGITSSNLMSTAGQDTGKGLEYTLMGSGAILMIFCISSLIKMANEKKTEDDHSNNIFKVLFMIVLAVIGLALVAIGWKGASALEGVG